MSARHTIAAIAGANISFGAQVRLLNRDAAPQAPVVAVPEADPARIDGVLLRTAFADRAAEGEAVVVITDGGLMALTASGHPAWVEIREGKIVDA